MQSPHAERVAATVRAELARQRKSQLELAEHSGKTAAYWSRRTTGAVPFDVDDLGLLADFLGVTAASLLGDPATAVA